MSAKTRGSPKVLLILAGLGVVWLAMTAGLMQWPPPDPFLGEWVDYGVFLVVNSDFSYRKVDRYTGQDIESGTWERIEMPVYHWEYQGASLDGTRRRYYTQADLDHAPALLEDALLRPEPRAQVYRVGNQHSPFILKGNWLITEGRIFAIRNPPDMWWKTAWENVQGRLFQK